MYSILQYGHMIRDEIRTRAYAEALRRAVTPGCVVLDVGTGTGIFALLACRLGARRVYAVEPGACIETARAVARANGCADRIEFLEARVEDVELPERADVLVSDLRGALPWAGTHLPAVASARRWLRPGGRIVPASDTLWAAPADLGGLHERNLSVWTANPFGLDMAEARRLVANSLWSAGGVRTELRAEPRRLARVDYRHVDDPGLRASAGFVCERPGRAHGLLLWFDADLAPGVGFSNAPGKPDLVYGRIALPWEEPLELAAGDTVGVRLDAHLVGEDYVWTWETHLHRRGEPGLRLRQSTFLGAPLTREGLRAAALDRAPGLGPEGRIDREVLGWMDAGLPVESMAHRLAKRFPDRFPGWREALPRVSALAARYGLR